MRILVTTLFCLLVAGCASTYYGAMESFGIHKREILVDRISDAMKSQEEAKEQFASALDQFRSVVSFDGGDLEDLYERLADELDDSEDEAEEVGDRIASVKRVAKDLFKEWEDELDQYSDASLDESLEVHFGLRCVVSWFFRASGCQDVRGCQNWSHHHPSHNIC